MNHDRVKAMCEQRLRELDGHVLDVLLDNHLDACRIVVARLKKPGTRIMSTQVTFTPEGIAIQGDFTPGPENGLCCREGKSLGWFVGRLEHDYLASKFLPLVWEPLAQRDYWQGVLNDSESDDDSSAAATKLRELLASDCFGSAEELRDKLDELEINHDFEDFGLTRSEQATADLWAIQRKFAELWWARQRGFSATVAAQSPDGQ